MPHRLRPLLLGLLLAVLAWIWVGRRAEPPLAEVVPNQQTAPPVARPVEASIAGRQARAADPELVEAASRHMGSSVRNGRCGPYDLRTDVRPGPVYETCHRIGATLDAVYRERYGLDPLGEPAETILLFATAAGFRQFARESAGLRVGYAGFSNATRGFVALHIEGEPLAETATTLAHELTHLVHRRALGTGLPPWLSEGLADGIGDAATPDGLGPIEGRRGAEPLAKRLAGGYELGRARSLHDLVALRRAEFDRGTVSFDYEQSALLVRYLLADAERAARFRRFLRRLAQGEHHRAALLGETLEVRWSDLDRDFEAWVRG